MAIAQFSPRTKKRRVDFFFRDPTWKEPSLISVSCSWERNLEREIIAGFPPTSGLGDLMPPKGEPSYFSLLLTSRQLDDGYSTASVASFSSLRFFLFCSTQQEKKKFTKRRSSIAPGRLPGVKKILHHPNQSLFLLFACSLASGDMWSDPRAQQVTD